MWTHALMIALGSLLSSLLTLGLAYLFFEHRYKRRLQQEVDERIDAYLQRFQEVLDKELEKVGSLIEERVRRGVLEAIASLPTPQVLHETTKSVVRSGVDLMESGLSTLLGGRPKPR